MPIFKRWNEKGAIFAIWKVEESLEVLRLLLTADFPYDEELSIMKAKKRKLEYLAVRVLLKQICGEEKLIAYHKSGKPFIVGDNHRITISHTKGYVAIGIHASAEVGIDIEQVAERVRKLSSRFIHSDEIPNYLRLSDHDQLFQLLLHWSAKETMFKMMNASEINFLDQLKIFPFPLQAGGGQMEGQALHSGVAQRYFLSYITHVDFVCTYSVQMSSLPA